MASVTYLTRLLGYWVLRNRTLTPRQDRLLKEVPACVLIVAIAPAFTTTDIGTWIGLIATVLAAIRLSFVQTIAVAILVTAIARYFFGSL